MCEISNENIRKQKFCCNLYIILIKNIIVGFNTPRSKFRYPGDVKRDLTPKSANRGLEVCQTNISMLRSKIKVLKAKNLRHIRRISSLKSLLKELKNKFALSDHAAESIEVSFVQQFYIFIFKKILHKY